jgi:hypothetical protein
MEGLLWTQLVERCKREGGNASPPCRELLDNTQKWFPEGLTDAGTDKACDTFHGDQPHRLAKFKEWFQDGKLYDAAKDAPCAQNVGGTLVDGCMVAQLLVNPTSLAHKARCITRSPDTARDLVELAHILGEQARHRETMLALGMKPAADAFDEVMKGYGALTLNDVPHQALAYGVDVVGRFMKAYSVDPKRAKKWGEEVVHDMRKAAQTKPADVVDAILKTQSFIPATYVGQPIEFEDLRAAATHFVSLPRLYRAAGTVPASFDWSNSATRTIFDSLNGLTTVETSPHAAVYVLASELRALGDVVRTAAAVPALKGNEQAMRSTAAALECAGRVIKLGADRKWTELGGVLIDDLSTSMDDLSTIERPVRFVRTILAVYEAPNVEEAKAIFRKSLDDEASRERRFDHLTVDFGALVGGRWGGERRENDPSPTLTRPQTERSKVYGLYAPAGIQVAVPYFALLLYPVDLGTYLVKTSQTESSVPRWTEALRFGAAAYVRPWRTVPIVFGGGVDAQPKIEDHKSYRAQFTVGMELPLIQLR